MHALNPKLSLPVRKPLYSAGLSHNSVVRKVQALPTSPKSGAATEASACANERINGVALSRRKYGFAAVATILSTMLTPAGSQAADPTSSDYDGIATLIPEASVQTLTPTQRQIYSLNRRIQAQNRAKAGYPGFIREGFNVLVVGDGYVTTNSGLIYKDFREGTGELPEDGQEIVFQYTGYNESASQIDSSYNNGRPSQTRLGVPGLIPGFEEGLRTMRVGTQRRIIVPPSLGPPVGPSTFFSAKQCEVFDVEVLEIRSCRRETVGMFSKVVCE